MTTRRFSAPHQVYATKTGTSFHTAWCRIVADKWDNDPDRLYVIDEGTVGARKP